MRIAITGSQGLVGTALVKTLRVAGHEVVALVRREPRAGEVKWNVDSGVVEWGALNSIDALVHLAGESIAEGRWSAAKKSRIRSSRVDATAKLVAGLINSPACPKHFICASAIGVYGSRGDEELTERSASGEGFLADVGSEWEQASQPLIAKGVRVVWLRLGVVLSRHGGALGKMLLPFNLGLGGALGSGKQWMSWIALQDVVAAISFLLQHQQLSGAFNLTAPQPVTNYDFTRALGSALHRPTFMSVPAFALRLLLGEMADALLLSSTRVLPQRLLEAGFKFSAQQIEQGLRSALNE